MRVSDRLPVRPLIAKGFRSRLNQVRPQARKVEEISFHTPGGSELRAGKRDANQFFKF